VLKASDLAPAVARLHAQREAIRDRLNAADSILGDGDTGMTIMHMIERLHGASASLPPTVGAALTAWSRECMRASGSSLGTVIALGLGRAARLAVDQTEIGPADLAAMLTAAIDGITARAGSSLGDKTILDSLARIRQSMSDPAAADDMHAAALSGARAALDEFRDRPNRIGRACVILEALA
jgi:hypothetical protein